MEADKAENASIVNFYISVGNNYLKRKKKTHATDLVSKVLRYKRF